jgi:hypothetical protein
MKFALANGMPRGIRKSMSLSGLGASCPSDEQLAGIYDPQDPCQAANAAGNVAPISTSIAPADTSTLATCMPAGSLGPLAPGQVWCATGTAAAPVGNPSGSSPVSTTVVLTIAAVGLGLLVFMGGRR